MKITTLVSIDDQEIEVNVSMEDILTAIKEDPGSARNVLEGVNNFAQFFKAIPDEMIEDMTGPQRKLISEFLHEQSRRFLPPCGEPRNPERIPQIDPPRP